MQRIVFRMDGHKLAPVQAQKTKSGAVGGPATPAPDNKNLKPLLGGLLKGLLGLAGLAGAVAGDGDGIVNNPINPLD